MTKKDYEAIAKAILSERASIEARESDLTKARAGWAVTARIAVRLAQMMERDNERFDGMRFLTACGLSDEEINETNEAFRAHRRAVLASLVEQEQNATIVNVVTGEVLGKRKDIGAF